MRSEQRFSTYLYCSCGACWSGGVWGFQRRGSPRLYARRGGRASVHWLRETAARGQEGVASCWLLGRGGEGGLCRELVSTLQQLQLQLQLQLLSGTPQGQAC